MANGSRDRQAFKEGLLAYGLSSIRWLFLLNGGAIIALLGFISAIVQRSSPPVAAAVFAPAIVAFIVGLVFALGSSFFAYWNSMRAHGGSDKREKETTMILSVASGAVSTLFFMVGATLATCALTRF